jgi:hypothetical protein
LLFDFLKSDDCDSFARDFALISFVVMSTKYLDLTPILPNSFKRFFVSFNSAD